MLHSICTMIPNVPRILLTVLLVVFTYVNIDFTWNYFSSISTQLIRITEIWLEVVRLRPLFRLEVMRSLFRPGSFTSPFHFFFRSLLVHHLLYLAGSTAVFSARMEQTKQLSLKHVETPSAQSGVSLPSNLLTGAVPKNGTSLVEGRSECADATTAIRNQSKSSL